MKFVSIRSLAAGGFFLMLAACSQQAGTSAPSNAAKANASSPPASASQPSGTSGWIANGATACDRYLTPDVVGRIFPKADGHAKRLSGQSCAYETPEASSISITLMAAGRETFDTDPNTQGASPVSGVGDKAVRTMSGVEAFRNGKGICQIDVMPPFGNKLSGDALAHAIGDVCNRLFALP